MEYLTNERPAGSVRAVLFDFDGTISTLRCGWEEVMQPDTNHLHAKKKDLRLWPKVFLFIHPSDIQHRVGYKCISHHPVGYEISF